MEAKRHLISLAHSRGGRRSTTLVSSDLGGFNGAPVERGHGFLCEVNRPGRKWEP